MAAPDPDTTPEGDSILDMYGSPLCSTPPKRLFTNDAVEEPASFDTSAGDEGSFRTEGPKVKQLREIQKRLSSLAALSADDVSFSSSRGSPNTSLQPVKLSSRSTSISVGYQSPSLTRHTPAEAQLIDTISHARSTLRHDLLVALLERVVADTVSLYTAVSEEDTTARAAVDRVSLSLADFITRYVALTENKPSSLKLD